MNIFKPNWYLVLYIFTNVNGDEVTSRIEPLTRNDAKPVTVDTRAKNPERPNADETKETATVRQSKFDMKDFKVTTLKRNPYSDDEDCLATANPDKVAAVRKTLLSNAGKSNYVTSEPVNEEDKIAACLIKEDAKTGLTKDNATENLDTIEEVAMKLEGGNIMYNKQGRRDTEYQFDPLEYYDESITFDENICPDDLDVITLEISELKRYDVECELLTHWVGLAETMLQG